MRQLLGKAGYQVSLHDVPARPLGARDVRVRVRACGVCGTDLHFLRGAPDWTPLGHEIAGEVVETGPEVSLVQPGDRVLVEDNTLCGACEACKSGRIHLCENMLALGGQSGMADSLVADERMLHNYDRLFFGAADYTGRRAEILATDIDWAAASLVEPLSVAIRCVEALNLPRFGSLAVYGLGTIGLLCAAYAKRIGAERVMLVGRNPGRKRTEAAETAARKLGADGVCYAGDPLPQAFDAAIVAAPPRLCADALQAIKPGGTVLCAGVEVYESNPVPIDINRMVWHKQRLITSISEPAEHFPRSARLIRSGAIDARALITHQLPLTRAEALKTLYDADAPAIKTVVLPEAIS